MTAVRRAVWVAVVFSAGWWACFLMGVLGAKKVSYSDLRPGVRGDGAS